LGVLIVNLGKNNRMPDTIKLSQVLDEFDEKLLPNGKQKTFSIKFEKKDGELVYFNRAIATGLATINLKEHEMKGVLAVNKDLDKIDHPYPVKIWNIYEFNGHQVILK
jgi:hypothetical protein